jgi:uncharacterized protein YjiS (DUF1127 family)
MFLHEIRKRLAERLRIHRDIELLKSLDDVLLADIGMARSEIFHRVSGRT